jgi:membrane protease YdiL (CAAX protease family)/ABC-type Na+ efflux pump permease subunit
VNLGDVRLVFLREARDLLRDRRALFASLFLPALLYPALFFGTAHFRKAAEKSLENREVVVGFGPGAERIRFAIEGLLRRRPCRVLSGSFEPSDLAEGRVHAIVESSPAVPAPEAVVRFRSNSDLSAEAAARVGRALEDWREEARRTRLETWGVLPDPAAAFRFEAVDAALPERAGGALLGRLLPLVLVLVTISAGSVAALEAFAAERERGTLETLLVHPVAPSDLATGKFLAILAASLAAAVTNVASLGATVALGGAGGASHSVSLSALAGAFLLLVPTAAFLAGLLAEVSARARTFREGQNYVLPLSLACMVPGLAAFLPGIELTPLLALVPIGGTALAIREVLKGGAPLLPVALAGASATVYAALLVRRTGRLLDAERILRDEPPEAEASRAHLHSRRTLGATAATFLLVFYLGFPAQARDPIGGLLATLYGIVLPCAFLVARASGLPPREAFRLSALRPAHVLAAAALVPAAGAISGLLLRLQERFLPTPESLLREMAEKMSLDTISPSLALLLFAASPGLCEELLFRGAILRGLRRDLPAAKAVAISSLLFGAFHFEIHRLVPQAALGALLAALTLRAGSLWPAVLLHAGHNALVLFAGEAVSYLLLDPRFLVASALGAFAAFRLFARPGRDAA